MRTNGFLILLVLLAAGCELSREGESAPPDRQAAAREVRVELATMGELTLRKSSDPCAIVVRRVPATRVLVRRGEEYEAISWSEIHVGDVVDLWLEGLASTGCPARGQAAAIVRNG